MEGEKECVSCVYHMQLLKVRLFCLGKIKKLRKVEFGRFIKEN